MGMSGLDAFLGAKAYMCCTLCNTIAFVCVCYQDQFLASLPSLQSVSNTMSEQEMHPSVAQRIVIKFRTKEGVKPVEILRRLRAQFGESNLSQIRVYEWHKSFLKGRETVENESH